MDLRNEIGYKDVEALGLDEKYFQIDTQERARIPEWMSEKIKELRGEDSSIVVRRFSKKRVLETLFTGTDRVPGGLINTMEVDNPSFSQYGPRYEYQDDIMKQRGLRNEQITWGIRTSTKDSRETFDDLYEDPENDAILVYNADDIEDLGGLQTFKVDPQKALIAVFADFPLSEVKSSEASI